MVYMELLDVWIFFVKQFLQIIDKKSTENQKDKFYKWFLKRIFLRFLEKQSQKFPKKSLPLSDFSKHRIQHAQAFWQIGLSERQGTRPFLNTALCDSLWGMADGCCFYKRRLLAATDSKTPFAAFKPTSHSIPVGNLQQHP